MKNSTVPNIPTVTVKELCQDIQKIYETCIENDLPLLNVVSYGLPGIGKSECIKELASKIDIRPILGRKGIRHNIDSKGIGFINRRLSQVFLTDIQGNPINIELEDGEIKQTYSTPSYLPSISVDGEYGLLLFDELNMASPTVAGMIQQLLDSRKIGSYTLPKGWMILSGMNLRSMGCHVNELSSANNSRVIHYNVQEDLDSWIKDYAILNKIDPLIISYLKNEYPNHFYVLPTSEQKNFPCPRTWTYASTLIKAGLIERVDSAVGDAIGASFKSYYETKNQMPDWLKAGLPDYKYEYDKSDLSLPWAIVQVAVFKTNIENLDRLVSFIDGYFGTEYLATYVESVNLICQSMAEKSKDYSLMEKLSEAKIKNGRVSVTDLVLDIQKDINLVEKSK